MPKVWSTSVNEPPQSKELSASLKHPLLEVHRALEAVRWIYTLGADWTPAECREVLDRMSPFLGRQYLDGSQTRLVSSNLLMLIWAAVGDAYRELSDFTAAAEAYRHATGFRPSCAYGDYYADIALSHSLTHHYEVALLALEGGGKDWSRYKWSMRTVAHVYSFARHPFGYIVHLKETLRRGRRIRELRRRIEIQGRKGGCTGIDRIDC